MRRMALRIRRACVVPPVPVALNGLSAPGGNANPGRLAGAAALKPNPPWLGLAPGCCCWPKAPRAAGCAAEKLKPPGWGCVPLSGAP